MEMAKATAKNIFTELVSAGSAQDESRLYRWARQSQGADKLRNMLFLAQSELGITHRLSEFDADPYLLNVSNGVLNLKTGTLLPHSREDLLSKITHIIYDPDADYRLWDKFLLRIMNNRPELVSFLQRAIGYTLTGSTAAQVLFFLWGMGQNGKSVLREVLHRLMGEYAQSAASDLLMLKQRSIPNDIARLAGARLVTVPETADNQRFHEPILKEMSGSDVITARFLHREYFDYRPNFKLWIVGNHRPRIVGTDNGIWRRFNLVPFIVTIPEAERIPFDDLLAMLSEELPGILSWAVRGCLEWQKTGLQPPQDVTEATSNYRREMDTLGEFLDDCCTLEAETRVSAGALYSSYREWCDASGHEAMSQTRFGRNLDERGFEKGRDNAGRKIYRRLGLNSPNSPNTPAVFHPTTRTHIEENPENRSDCSDCSEPIQRAEMGSGT